ncbi:MAG: FecR domain-containing protein [Gallionella sp.]
MNIASAIQPALTLFLLALPTAQGATVKVARAGNLYVVKGVVQIAQGKMAPHSATNSEAVYSNTLINTGENSAALLKFSDGQIVNLLANTALLIRDFQYNPDTPKASVIVLSMISGSTRFVTGNIGLLNKQAFRLSAPNATIGIRGTDFMLAMHGKNMYGHVQSGSITMTNASGVMEVEAGQNVLASASISLVSASAVPSGIFSELLAMPVDPTAIAAQVASKDVAPGIEATGPAVKPAVALPAETLITPIPLAALTIPDHVAADVVAHEPIPATPVLPAMIAPEEKPAPKPEAEKLSIVETIPEAPVPESRNDEPTGFAGGNFGTGVAGKLGTLGYGAELAVSISDNRLTARDGVNTFTYKYNANSSSINYDFKLQLENASVLADWYPFSGSFRTSVGVLYNNNEINLLANPTGGSYTIGNVSYPASQINSLAARVSFRPLAPYLGVGWGNPVAKNKGWGMLTDIGVLFQGSPVIDLVATCNPSAACTNLQANAEIENARLQNDLRKFKYWPVASIGISYQW